MKDIKKSLKGAWPGERYRWLFCSLFLLYLFLGLCLFGSTDFAKDPFFGADNTRVFLDLTDIGYSHYRTKVHPLFPLLTETITLLVNGVANRPAVSVVLVEAFCGASSVCVFSAILERKKAGAWIQASFTFLYGASFSTLLFSAIPETFIFAGLSLLCFWYFLTVAVESKAPLSKGEVFLLLFFGLLCFGVTLTNYVFYLVGLLYLLLCRYGARTGGKLFLKINVLNSICVVMACHYQRYVWRQCPLFWTSMIDGATGKAAYEEVYYMDWTIGIDKTIAWIKGTIFRPLLSPSVYLGGSDHERVVFYGYPLALKLLLLLFCALLAAGFVRWAVKRSRQADLVEDGYILCLAIAYGGNLLLHYIYGSSEAFLYSQHYLFYILLIAAFTLDAVEDQKVKRIFLAFLGLFCIVEAVNNLCRFFETGRSALSTIDSTINIVHACKGTMMCGGLLFAAILLESRWCLQGSIPTCRCGDRESWIRRSCRIAMVYGALVMITSLFIAFSY